MALKPSVVDLVDQDGGVAGRGRPGGRINDAEGVEERVDDVDHQQEERGGRQQRELDVPEPAPGPPSMAAASDQRLGDGPQAREENRKLWRSASTRGSNHDQRHRVVGVHQVVPVSPTGAAVGHHAQRGENMNIHNTPATAGQRRRAAAGRSCRRWRPLMMRSAKMARDQRQANAHHRHQNREEGGGLEGCQVARVLEQGL